MNILTWLKIHKYQILFYIAMVIMLLFIRQAMQKDHSLDLVKMELKLKEENRLLLEEKEKAWEQVIKEKDQSIFVLKVRDSLVQQNILVLNSQLDKLSNQYNAKAKIINTYGSDDLREYFRNLPRQPDNDY